MDPGNSALPGDIHVRIGVTPKTGRAQGKGVFPGEGPEVPAFALHLLQPGPGGSC